MYGVMAGETSGSSRVGSIGTTNQDLCKLAGKLVMPTALVGQNAARLKPILKVAVSGC
jgi:hypothetical protein